MTLPPSSPEARPGFRRAALTHRDPIANALNKTIACSLSIDDVFPLADVPCRALRR